MLEWNLTFYNSMAGPRGYYAKWKNSDRKKKTCDFTYMWNLKIKTNKQIRNRLLETENRRTVDKLTEDSGLGGLDGKGERIKKCNW